MEQHKEIWCVLGSPQTIFFLSAADKEMPTGRKYLAARNDKIGSYVLSFELGWIESDLYKFRALRLQN